MSKIGRDFDNQRIYGEGVRHGRINNYSPPHDRGVVSEILFGYTKDEAADRRAYDEGWTRGKKSR